MPNEYAFIEHAFRTLPLFKGEEARIALDMEFDVYYGLQRMEEAANNPLLSIAMSPLEEYGRNGPLFKALELYAKSSVAEFFPGLDVIQYMDLPREVRDYVLIISEQRKAAKTQAEQDAINGALGNKPGSKRIKI